MTKNELIAEIRKAQAAQNGGTRVLAESTLNSYTKGTLEAMLADLSCENGEHCASYGIIA